MRLPPTGEALDADDLPYPIETIRFWYVSPFGGRSRELQEGQVGVNRQALEANTVLEASDRVTVGLVGTAPERPWAFQETFEIVALDGETPRAAGLSPRGEIVLAEAAFDFARRPHLQPRVGDAVLLKAVATNRLDFPPDWLRELLDRSVRRPDF